MRRYIWAGNLLDGHTFDEMDEKIRFVKVVREAKVETAERYGAVTAAPDAAPLSRSRSAQRGRPDRNVVHLLTTALLDMVQWRGIVGWLIRRVLLVGRQPDVDGRLPLVEFRLESAKRSGCGRHRSWRGRTEKWRGRSLALVRIGRCRRLDRVHFAQRAQHGRSGASDQRRSRSRRRNGRIASRWRDGRERVEQRRKRRSRTDHRARVRCQIQVVAAANMPGSCRRSRNCRSAK